MKKVIPVLPWRVLVPVFTALGLGLTIWGGVHLIHSSYTNWTDKVELRTDTRLSSIRSNWGKLEGHVDGITSFFSSTQAFSEERFEQAARKLIEQTDGVKGIVFKWKGLDGIYAYPVTLKGKAMSQAMVQTLEDADLSATGLQVADIGLNNRFKKLVSHNQDAITTFVHPVQGSVFSGALIALVDFEEFVRSADTAQKTDASLTTTVFDKGGNVVSAMSVYTLPEGEDPSLSYTQTAQIAAANTEFSWSFPSNAYGGAVITPGILVIILGMLVTGAIGWVLLMQQRLSSHIQQEVVERTNQLEQASRRFRLITDNAYDLISIVDSEGKYEYVNSAYHRVLGYNRDDLKEQKIADYIHPKDIESFKRVLREVSDGKNAAEVTFRMRHSKGRWIYLEAVAKGLYDNDWSLSNIAIHCRDITSRKMYADELARSEQRFRDFADSSADWLWEVNEELEFTYVSPGIKSTLGFAPEDIIGQLKFDALFDKETDPTKELIQSRIDRHQPYRDIEFWTRSKGGERVCLRISGVPVFDEQQKFAGYRGAATNITASKIDRDNMYRLATTDHLTGLLNRNRFVEELERTVSLARRHKTQGVLMFIDLDRFKEINDTHGHEAGDAILKEVSSILQDSVRSTDIVARLGGDEFGIIMHNISVKRAQEKMQQVIDRINALRVEYHGAKLHVSMSIGMITYPQEDKSSSNLIMSADLAMYRAKDMGRNRLYVDMDGNGQDQTSDSVREQLKWVQRLRKALETGDFEMHYQPIIPADSKDEMFFEALIRLRDEEGRLGSPVLFIDAAEHFGLIQQLDLSVIERCISELEQATKKGMDLRFSINLSSRSLGDPEVIDKLHEVVKKYDINPAHVTFEVTETAAIHDPSALRDIDEIRNFIIELRKLGFKFALDDFGTGFSSFSYIRSLEVDIIKIDGSFVRDLESSDQDKLFVKAISDLAQGLGIKTVAEFVENEGILSILKDLGVHYAQGYHISRPEGSIEQLYKDFTNKNMSHFMGGGEKKKAAAVKSAAKKTGQKATKKKAAKTKSA